MISIEEGRSTTRNFVNKATQSETESFIKYHVITGGNDTVETSYLLRQLEGSFNTRLTEFSANILGSVSEVIDEKIGEMGKKLAIMPENLNEKFTTDTANYDKNKYARYESYFKGSDD